MVNSTAKGGGVAEGLPRIVSLMRQLGVHTEWVVISPNDQRFFSLTKRLHNLMHGVGDQHLSLDDRALYESVSRSLAKEFRAWLKPDDLLVVNDPQPLGMGALLKRELGLRSVWRCHIGAEGQTPATQAACAFLKPWVHPYDRAILSLKEYMPPFLLDRTDIIYPTIDPLSYKNRELSAHELTGILEGAALTRHLSLSAPFEAPALRLQRGGSFAPAVYPEDFGLLSRPIVAQISRWDYLKGFGPLLRGFAYLKKNGRMRQRSERHQWQLDSARLVLAGPDPDGIQDDPEAQEVFQEVCGLWESLNPGLQQDIAILKLPMDSPKANHLLSMRSSAAPPSWHKTPCKRGSGCRSRKLCGRPGPYSAHTRLDPRPGP